MHQYQVSFGTAVQRAFYNYCNFYGRASRSEFWWFYLFTVIVAFILSSIETFFAFTAGAGSPVSIFAYSLECLFAIAIFLPQLGLSVRRLHDIGKSGWNLLWALLPIAGAIILLVYYCRDSQWDENRYGPIPNLTDDPNLY